MDVFKLLSKSSKVAHSTSTQKLPSSGAVVNPQLFGHSEPTQSSRKRKRGQGVSEPAAELPADLDFFGGVSQGRRKDELGANGPTRHGETQLHKDCGTDSKCIESPLDNGTESHDEVERKRTLRAHKLKIVVLEDFAAQERPTGSDEKKAKKERKREKEGGMGKVDKKDKKQLFPKPLTSFTRLRTEYGISRRLAMNIEEQGYKVPTEVQIGALPLLLGKNDGDADGVRQNGHMKEEVDISAAKFGDNIDLLTVAPTGSGKTIAFLIPIINAVLSEGKVASEVCTGPRAVIVAPTKELASQIVNEARKLTKGTSIKAALMKKGMEVVERPASESEADDGSDSSEPSDGDENSDSDSSSDHKPTKPKSRRRRANIVKAAILVATPLALLHALRRSDHISGLPSTRYLVLDEADVLLDPLFREQTLSIWNSCTNPHLRVSLWSATMGSNIENLAIQTLNNRWKSFPSTSSLPSRPPLIRLVVGLKDTAIPNIAHKLIYAATEQGKLLGLRQLLHPTALPSSDSSPYLRPPFLVFTQTIPRAIALHSELLYDIPPEAGGSSRIAVLHADLSSSTRDAVMTRFRRGEVWILITTDLLARGVDFRGLNGVVNYDIPSSAAAYVHRVGRTGRAGRDGGVAVTFYTKEDIPHVKNVANVIRASERSKGVSEEEGSVKQWLLDALPTPSKREKKVLRRRGVEARRPDRNGKMRISTKSGYERKKDNNIRGANMARRRREREVGNGDTGIGSETEFEGFGE